MASGPETTSLKPGDVVDYIGPPETIPAGGMGIGCSYIVERVLDCPEGPCVQVRGNGGIWLAVGFRKREATDADLASAPLATSLRMYPAHDQRVGMRSGMMDAAHLCDLIAAEIGKAGRDSMQRRAMVAVAKRCADAIEAMRGRVEVPPADTSVPDGTDAEFPVTWCEKIAAADAPDVLAEDIDAWHDDALSADESAPDFWDECDTAARLAEWLIERGWKKSA